MLRCIKHPKYLGKRKPRSGCENCLEIYSQKTGARLSKVKKEDNINKCVERIEARIQELLETSISMGPLSKAIIRAIAEEIEE